MPRPWQMARHFETVTDTMVEQIASIATYNVVSGCEPSFSSSDLTVTVGAGSVKHNGTSVTVAGSSVTLIPDGTNPLWAWVAINSSGAAVVVHGTAAANPTVPELGDYVEIALVLVEANQTIASRCAVKQDKRLFGARSIAALGGAATAILNSNFTLNTTWTELPDLTLDVTAGTTYAFRSLIHYKVATSAQFGIKFDAPVGSKVVFNYAGTDTSATLGAYRGITYNTTAEASAYTYLYGYGTTVAGVVAVNGSLVVGSTAGEFKVMNKLTTNVSSCTTLQKSRLELL